jgi:hypothetical protein
MVGTDSRWVTRQSKIWVTTGPRCGSGISRVRVQALGGFEGGGVLVPVGAVPVGGRADVPPVDGVLDQAVPAQAQHLEPVELAGALLDPADQDGGRAGAFQAGRFVGGEDRDAGPGQVFFHGQRGEVVAGYPADVLADHHAEPGGRAGGVGEQVGDAAVAGDAQLGGDVLPGLAVAAVGQVQSA